MRTGDRSNLEKRFREWLARCHAQLDKRIRFLGITESPGQAWCPCSCRYCCKSWLAATAGPWCPAFLPCSPLLQSELPAFKELACSNGNTCPAITNSCHAQFR